MSRFALCLVLTACGRLGFDEVAPSCRVTAVAAQGDQACAARQDGSLWCWGSNGSGQLGDGTFADRGFPAPAVIDAVASVSAGEFTVCAVRRDGTLWCWGQGTVGQVGDGAGADRAVPAQVALPAAVTFARGGQYHTCAGLADGSGWCWGDNAKGELGYAAPARQLAPQPAQVGRAESLAIGDEMTCSVEGGVASCWGRNTTGELGDGTRSSRPMPQPITAIGEPVREVVAGCHHHVCAITTSGAVWCWGLNADGQLGQGRTTPSEPIPTQVAGIPPAAQLAVGAFHTCMRAMNGELWCWGNNERGQLGLGSRTPSPTPARLPATTDVPVDVQAGCSNTYALLADGTLLGWGAALQVGTGSALDQPSPVEVPLPCDD